MASWRLKRRLTYTLLFVGLAAGLAAALFLLSKPAPSCFDGKQNQGEVGIDCGGPCAKVCPTEIKDIRVIWGPRILEVGEGRYDTVTLIQNPNPRHAARSFNYLIKIFDADNLLITTRYGSAFLNPRESFAIFESRIDVGRRRPARAVFELDGAPLWQKVERTAPELTVTRKDFVLEPALRLTVEAENHSLLALRDITVVAVLFDEYQNVVGISSTLIDELAPRERKEIVFTWPAPFKANVTIITFYPHLDLARLPAP